MFERKQTINGVEYEYNYGGNGTISITSPIKSSVDLKQLPNVSIHHDGDVSDEQRAHLDAALQPIIEDMFAQMPKR